MDRVTVAVDFERRETKEFIIDAAWAPVDFSDMEQRVHRQGQDFGPRVGYSRKRLDIFLPALYVRPKTGALPRAASRRKHKRRTRKQFIFLWVNPLFGGTTTGRISQSDPARYNILPSGRIVRTPRD